MLWCTKLKALFLERNFTMEWPRRNIGMSGNSFFIFSACRKQSSTYSWKSSTWTLLPSLCPWPTEIHSQNEIKKLLMVIAPDKALFFFIGKVETFFLFSPQKCMLWYLLKALWRGTSYEYPQHMFSWRNKRNLDMIISLLSGAMLCFFFLFFFRHVMVITQQLKDQYSSKIDILLSKKGLINWYMI